jgi:stage II sporulation protein AA (anti-sigma F factor antagonist)
MEVLEQVLGGVTILEPRGRIDSVTAKEFGDRLSKVLSTDCHQLVVDLRNVTYICSSGFRQLLIAKRSAQEKKRKLALRGVTGDVKRLFTIGAFDQLLPIYETREAGIAGVQ